MPEIGIGVVGAGYMGKAHSVALNAVGPVFNTNLRPICEMICTRTAAGAAERAREFGFRTSTADWRELVENPRVAAIVIASPQNTHREIALAAFALGKPVLCEKPLGETVADSRAMVAAAEEAGVTNMVAFNYVRTPATQLARQMIEAGEIGRVVHLRAEHTEDFLADPAAPAHWRTRSPSSGTLGDLAPHIVNGALALAGPIELLVADVETVHKERQGPEGLEPVANEDQAHLLCRFESGAMGSLTISRVAMGRKMGYAYEVTGTKGALRFDQEDQNALHYYRLNAPRGREGFTKILIGPDHPDYLPFCQGPGHGTGYQDQIIIEAKDFLLAIETGKPVWPTFADGLAVNRLIEAIRVSYAERRWVQVADI